MTARKVGWDWRVQAEIGRAAHRHERLQAGHGGADSIGRSDAGESSREPKFAPSVRRNWMRLVERGSKTAVEAGEEVVALGRVEGSREAGRELQRLVGKQANYGVRRVHALVNRERRRIDAKPYDR